MKMSEDMCKYCKHYDKNAKCPKEQGMARAQYLYKERIRNKGSVGKCQKIRHYMLEEDTCPSFEGVRNNG